MGTSLGFCFVLLQICMNTVCAWGGGGTFMRNIGIQVNDKSQSHEVGLAVSMLNDKLEVSDSVLAVVNGWSQKDEVIFLVLHTSLLQMLFM